MGILHFRLYKNIKLKKLKIPKNKLVISFFIGSKRLVSNAFQNVREILELNKNKKLIKKIYLIVRLHPNFYFNKNKKYSDEQKKILNRYGDQVTFINPKIDRLNNSKLLKFDLKQDLQEIKSILVNSKIVISQYSTTMLEACIFNKPVINYTSGNYANTNYSKKIIAEMHYHIKKYQKFNYCANLENSKDLLNEINKIYKIGNFRKKNQNKVLNKVISGLNLNSKKIFLDKISSICS